MPQISAKTGGIIAVLIAVYQALQAFGVGIHLPAGWDAALTGVVAFIVGLFSKTPGTTSPGA